MFKKPVDHFKTRVKKVKEKTMSFMREHKAEIWCVAGTVVGVAAATVVSEYQHKNSKSNPVEQLFDQVPSGSYLGIVYDDRKTHTEEWGYRTVEDGSLYVHYSTRPSMGRGLGSYWSIGEGDDGTPTNDSGES